MTELFSLYNKVKRLIDFQEMDIEKTKHRLFALYEMSLEWHEGEKMMEFWGNYL